MTPYVSNVLPVLVRYILLMKLNKGVSSTEQNIKTESFKIVLINFKPLLRTNVRQGSSLFFSFLSRHIFECETSFQILKAFRMSLCWFEEFSPSLLVYELKRWCQGAPRPASSFSLPPLAPSAAAPPVVDLPCCTSWRRAARVPVLSPPRKWFTEMLKSSKSSLHFLTPHLIQYRTRLILSARPRDQSRHDGRVQRHHWTSDDGSRIAHAHFNGIPTVSTYGTSP